MGKIGHSKRAFASKSVRSRSKLVRYAWIYSEGYCLRIPIRFQKTTIRRSEEVVYLYRLVSSLVPSGLPDSNLTYILGDLCEEKTAASPDFSD